MGNDSPVESGTKFPETPLWSAAFINDLIRMRAAWLRTLNGGGAGGGLTGSPIVQIKNLTDSDLKRGNIVQIGDMLLGDHDPASPWFEGNAVTDPLDQKLAIASNAILEDKIGEAITSGVCCVRVNVTDTGHGFAKAADGAILLVSAASGPIQLLTVPTGTGEQELWGQFLNSSNPGIRLVKTTAGATALTPTIYYKIYTGTAGSESDSGATDLPAAVSRVDIDAGKFCLRIPVDSNYELLPLECNDA